MNLKQYRRPIRITSIACAFVGIILNLVTVLVSNVTYRFHSAVVLTGCAFLPLVLSIAGNHIILNDKSICKVGIDPFLLVLLDYAATLSFLVILIANGVIVNHVGNDRWGNSSKVQMLVYNSMPWVLIGMCHTFLALEGFVTIISDRFPQRRTRREVRCLECQRNVTARTGVDMTDESTEPLINPKYNEEEDGEVRT